MASAWNSREREMPFTTSSEPKKTVCLRAPPAMRPSMMSDRFLDSALTMMTVVAEITLPSIR